MRAQAAYTLLELLVTMALAALLTGLAVPAYRTFSQNLVLKQASTALHSDLHHARLAAVNRNGRVTVCPGTPGRGCLASPDWANGWLVFHDLNADRQWQATETLLRTAPSLGPLTARSSDARSRLTFFPNGSAPGSNATIYLCDGRGPAHGHQVRVSMSGRVRMTRARNGGPTGC